MNDATTNVLKSLVPVIGTIVGGPVGAIASAGLSWLTTKLGLPEGSVEAVTDAVMGMDPTERIKLEQEFAKWQAEFSLKREIAYLEDVQSARARDAEFLKSGKRNYRADLIVLATFLGLAFVIGLSVWSSDLDEYAKGALSTALGLLISEWKTITQFEFGSTRTGRAKDDTINNLTKGA